MKNPERESQRFWRRSEGIPDAAFGEEEQQFILEAIANHRGQNERNCGKNMMMEPRGKILPRRKKTVWKKTLKKTRRIAKSRRFMELIHRSDKNQALF
ncbi:MAG: hypothetical protein ACLR1N_02130 [Bifidobacterium pseudocatenulatum]